MAAIAGGLAVGTKGTAVFAAPSLFLILGGVGPVSATGRPCGTVAFAVGAAVAGIVAFGAFNYLLNLEATGGPFGGLSDQLRPPGPGA